MINVDEEISLAYLLDPAFQLVNTAGKPLTDGWLEVYIHGTRNKYYCYKDWDKEFLHPFKIPLDSLGSNIVLASPAHAYDIYVYNKFGSLIMSRYNIVPVTGDGTVIKDVVNIKSEDTSVNITSSVDAETDTKTFDLSVNTDIFEAGNCIDVSKNGNNVTFSFDVAAGITDIKLVDTLPAEPTSTVLYLIPEES